VNRVIGVVCRRAQLFGPDAEDFASEVKVALIDDGYAILARYEGRSSLDTFLTVVIQRLLADRRTRLKGRWHASAEAERHGAAAVMLETLVRRDGRSLDEALVHLRAAHPGLTREEAARLLERLPERVARPRAVDLEAMTHAIAGGESADERALAGDRKRMSERAAIALRELIEAMPPDDRLLLRLRFTSGMSIADIARAMVVPQRPLYRRLEALLARLRAELLAAGIDAATAGELIGSEETREMDFGLGNGKSAAAGPSIAPVADHAREES
jgi:RNA polymerase sigma factor for flagellar operon FliA